MRLVKIALFTIIATTAIQASAAPARGQATIPPFVVNADNPSDAWRLVISISNTTRKHVSVAVVFYDRFGVIISDPTSDPVTGALTAENVANYVDKSEDASATFEIAAGNTSKVTLSPTSGNEHGYGRIEWKQNGSAAVTTLIAQGFVHRSATGTVEATYSIPINDGMPF